MENNMTVRTETMPTTRCGARPAPVNQLRPYPAYDEKQTGKVITLGEGEDFEIHRLGDLARVFNGPRFKRPYADIGVTTGPTIRKYFTGIHGLDSLHLLR